jgi:hypothetical protein
MRSCCLLLSKATVERDSSKVSTYCLLEQLLSKGENEVFVLACKPLTDTT